MELEKIIDEALAKYPKQVSEYKNGKLGLMGLFVGETMKMTRGTSDPKEVNKIIKEKLDK